MIEIFHSIKLKKIINELAKTFSIGENGMNPLGILPIPENILRKDPENIYF